MQKNFSGLSGLGCKGYNRHYGEIQEGCLGSFAGSRVNSFPVRFEREYVRSSKMFLLDKKTWYAIIKVIQENLANRFLNCVIYAGGQMNFI